MSKILVSEDEPVMREGIALALARHNHTVKEADDGLQALKVLSNESFDVVITDLKMPGADGIEILKKVKESNPQTAVIIITAFGTIEKAVEVMKLGADDFITKPFYTDELMVKISRILEKQYLQQEHLRLFEENKSLRDEVKQKYCFENIIGTSPAMQKVFERMDRLSRDGDSTVLIRGESGTGKELVARAIHYNEPRKEKPFVAVQCAALPETLLETELFGYEKGAFTDAKQRTSGKFELAHQGSIFLDEIGDISLNLQIKLLRVLEEKEFYRLCGDKPIKVDVRIIAATHRDLEKAVEDGAFRKDLYYRLNVIPVFIPPLRERKSDLPLLVNHFLKKYTRQKHKKLQFQKEVLAKFYDYDWPGNVRELEHVIEQIIVLADESVATTNCLPAQFQKVTSISIPEQEVNLAKALTIAMEEFEQRFIAKFLKKNTGNISKTAIEIGASRPGLHRKIKKYGL